MGYIIVILLSYLMGCSNMALYISKFKKVDLQTVGSRNLGASNTAISIGWAAGIATAIHDIGKSALAVILAQIFFPQLDHIGAVAGIAAVMGHIFPFYLKFKGGKGFASYYGMTLALNWKLALVVGVLIIVMTVITDYIVAGTVTTITVVPAYIGIATGNWLTVLILCVGTAVILYKHRENFVRIFNGTEFRLRQAIKGEHKKT